MILIYARIWITKDTQTTRIQLLIFKQYNVVNNFRFDQIIEKRASGTINTENRENIQNLTVLTPSIPLCRIHIYNGVII